MQAESSKQEKRASPVAAGKSPTNRFGPDPRVLLLENVHPSAHSFFTQEGFIVDALPKALSEDELIAKLRSANYQLLGIRSKTTLTAKTFQSCPKLLAVGCFCIGTNQVALDAAKLAGVPVFNAPYANTRSVAELVMGEIVCLARGLCDRSSEMHRGIWMKTATGCCEVRGKTLGIVGYGHIGSQLGVLAESFGMRVLFVDVIPKLPMGNNRVVDDLDALLSTADFVSMHVPELPETKGMIGKEQLGRMKKGAVFLNLSRGTVVDIDALAEALSSGHLGGASVDVFPVEPEENGPGFVTPLQGQKNVIMTPHIGGSTMEAQAEIGREVGFSMSRYLSVGATTGSVNFPIVEGRESGSHFHRICNVHRNLPGVLRAINGILADLNANVRSQVLATDEHIGYLVLDTDEHLSTDIIDSIDNLLKASIKSRVIER